MFSCVLTPSSVLQAAAGRTAISLPGTRRRGPCPGSPHRDPALRHQVAVQGTRPSGSATRRSPSEDGLLGFRPGVEGQCVSCFLCESFMGYIYSHTTEGTESGCHARILRNVRSDPHHPVPPEQLHSPPAPSPPEESRGLGSALPGPAAPP